MMLFALVPGIIFPTANASLMNHFRGQAAVISALTATLMFLSSAIFSWIESHMEVSNLWELSWLILTITLLSIVIYYLNGSRNENPIQVGYQSNQQS